MEKLPLRLEDYLETIYFLVKEKGFARVTDIANLRNVKKSTITEALKQLALKGYINYKPYSTVTLTEKGKEYAKNIIRKHQILKDFYKKVLFEENKEEELCNLEHFLSKETLKKIEALTKFFEEKNLSKDFKEFISQWLK